MNSGGKTNAMFESLRDWCDHQEAIGPTPRLIHDDDQPEGLIICFEGADPTVRMSRATRLHFQRWLEVQARFLF